MPAKKCLDCINEGNPEPRERYKATSYCLPHNSHRAQQSQKSAVLKQIIAAKNWDKLQEKKPDGTYRHKYIDLLPLIQHYRALAEQYATTASNLKDHDSRDYAELVREAVDFAEIARCLQERKGMSLVKKFELQEELALTPVSEKEPAQSNNRAVEPSVEAARLEWEKEQEDTIDPATGKAVKIDQRQNSMMPGKPPR